MLAVIIFTLLYAEWNVGRDHLLKRCVYTDMEETGEDHVMLLEIQVSSWSKEGYQFASTILHRVIPKLALEKRVAINFCNASVNTKQNLSCFFFLYRVLSVKYLISGDNYVHTTNVIQT